MCVSASVCVCACLQMSTDVYISCKGCQILQEPELQAFTSLQSRMPGTELGFSARAVDTPKSTAVSPALNLFFNKQSGVRRVNSKATIKS